MGSHRSCGKLQKVQQQRRRQQQQQQRKQQCREERPATLRLREAARGDPSLSPETAPWALSKCSLVARPSRCLASAWHAVGAQQMTVAGCHLSALHQSPRPSSPGSSTRRARKPPCLCGGLRLRVQQAGSGAERVLAGWWGVGGAVQPGQPARLPGTSTAPPCPPEGRLGTQVPPGFRGARPLYTHKAKVPPQSEAPTGPAGGPPHRGCPCELSSHTHWTQRPVTRCRPRGMQSHWLAPSPWLPASGTREVFQHAEVIRDFLMEGGLEQTRLQKIFSHK